jgi:hypothetical protein
MVEGCGRCRRDRRGKMASALDQARESAKDARDMRAREVQLTSPKYLSGTRTLVSKTDELDVLLLVL